MRRGVSVEEHVPYATRYLGQCIHAWVIAQPGGEFAEVCADCGAGCNRDGGKIVVYDAQLPIEERKKPKKGVAR